MSGILSAVYQSMASGQYFQQSKAYSLHLRGIFIELLLQWQYSSCLILAMTEYICNFSSWRRHCLLFVPQSLSHRDRCVADVVIFGSWTASGAINLFTQRRWASLAFSALCVLMSVSTSHVRATRYRASFHASASFYLSPQSIFSLFARRASFVALRTVCCLYVCQNTHTCIWPI